MRAGKVGLNKIGVYRVIDEHFILGTEVHKGWELGNGAVAKLVKKCTDFLRLLTHGSTCHLHDTKLTVEVGTSFYEGFSKEVNAKGTLDQGTEFGARDNNGVGTGFTVIVYLVTSTV
jgi:hypothetical protein